MNLIWLINRLTKVYSITASKEKEVFPTSKIAFKGINPKAQDKYWKEFVKKYSKLWKGKDYKDAWAVAIAVWRNFCYKRKISPFDSEEVKLTKDARKELTNRIISARRTLISFIEKLLLVGNTAGIVKSKSKEKILEVSMNTSGVSKVIVGSVIKLNKNIQPTDKVFVEWIKRAGFTRSRGVYTRELKAGVSVSIHIQDKVILTTTHVFTKPQLSILLGLSKDKLKDKTTVLKSLTTFYKGLIKMVQI